MSQCVIQYKLIRERDCLRKRATTKAYYYCKPIAVSGVLLLLLDKWTVDMKCWALVVVLLEATDNLIPIHYQFAAGM